MDGVDKKVIIGIVSAVALLLIIGLVVMRLGSHSSTSNHPTYGADAQLPKISADEIGFTVKKVDAHNVKITIAKTDGLKSFSYDVIYDAFARDENRSEEHTSERV